MDKTRQSIASSIPIFDAISQIARENANGVAIEALSGETCTFGSLVERAEMQARGLHALGVGAGHCVAVYCKTSISYASLILAVCRLGASYVPILNNFDLEARRRAFQMAQPVLVVHDGVRSYSSFGRPAVEIRALIEPTSDRGPPPRPDAEHVFRKLWSSGSTGGSKLIGWTQGKLLKERLRWQNHVGLRGSDRYFCKHTLDVAHATDLHLFSALLSGATCILDDVHAGDAALWETMADWRPTVMSALPEHYRDWLRHYRANGTRLPGTLRLAMCGGTYVSPETAADVADGLGFRLRQIYGSTEFGLAMISEESAGDLVLVNGVGARLEPLSQGTAGNLGHLILISDCTSEGYLGDADEHAAAFRGEEYGTGDVAEMVSPKTYRIVGRTKELLNVGGRITTTSMVDRRIQAELRLQNFATVVDPRSSESVTVFVDQPPGTPVEEERLQRRITAATEPLGLKPSIVFLHPFPYTEVGKPDKAVLRQKLATPVNMRLNCRELGRGFPLVILPGLCLTDAIFEPLIDLIQDEYRLLLIDLPGHGQNQSLPPEVTAGPGIIDRFCDGIYSLLAERGIEKFAVMGVSLGATVAYALATGRHADQISALVSIEQTPFLLADDGWGHAAFGTLTREGAQQILAGLATDSGEFSRQIIAASLLEATRIDKALKGRIVRSSAACDPRAMAALLADALSQDWRPGLQGATRNVMLVHGSQSAVYPTNVGSWLSENWDVKALLQLKTGGHLPFIDEPVMFSNTVKAFLKSTCGDQNDEH
ncbi:alpha/beta fold hydrolase [Bradyrhizobium huanghuaihaiense]|uniref:alpha/beta fold hydrolase n=1 Tax=Bradyrhizobium huanghuaihaiense TaxID=990078 RepID=UPI0021AA1317|nr:alpha/beta fold hydrolase [Bradyrhizobium sp. CB3035]UWU75261.1 alpha/beta fold hydrolase [Bradyrhizobium sp. CB3035]